MPLPEAGNPISADDINTDLGRADETELDFDETCRLNYNLSAPHSFSELYGLSGDGSLSGVDGGGENAGAFGVTPSTHTFLADPAAQNFDVLNNAGGTTTISSKPDWITIKNLSDVGFTAEATTQGAGSSLRQGIINVSNGTSTVPVDVFQLGVDETLTISDKTIDLVRQGTGVNVTVTSNTSWEFTSVASWIRIKVNNVETTSGTGTQTVNISAKSARDVCQASRSDTIVLSSANITIDDIVVTQAQGVDPTISITPDVITVGGLTTSINFNVPTNVGEFTVDEPSFGNGHVFNEFGFTLYLTTNNASGGSAREGTVTVTTVGCTTNVSDSATITQNHVPPEAISIQPQDGNYEIDPAGESNKWFDVGTVDAYNTTWLPKKVAFPGDPSGTGWATIVDSQGDSGDGSFRVTFQSNPAGGSVRRIGIGAYKVGNTNLQATTYLTQNPQESVSFSADRSMSNMLAWDNLDFGGTIAVSASTVNWTLSSNRSWLKLSKDNSTFTTSISGTNNDTIYLRLSPNTGGARAGSLTLSSNNAQVSTSTFAFSQVVGWVRGTEYAYGNTECEAEENGSGVNPI